MFQIFLVVTRHYLLQCFATLVKAKNATEKQTMWHGEDQTRIEVLFFDFSLKTPEHEIFKKLRGEFKMHSREKLNENSHSR